MIPPTSAVISSSLAAACLILTAPRLAAADIVFPADAGVIDVTKAPYHAVPDDGQDDTAAIQAALDASAQNNRIIYLPPGVYNVSAQLNWPGTNGGTTIGKRTILQGAGRDRSILLFHNPSVTSGSVLVTGGGAAQNFRNGIRDLTVRIAPGNSANLNGVTFVSNNQGTMRNVLIESVSRAGASGLNLAAGENGPLLVDNVEVVGFNYGVNAANTVVSQTIEHLRLREQNINGIRVHNQALFVRGLHSTNSVTVATTVRDTNAFLVLSDALLQGTGAASGLPAIFNDKTGYYRNIHAPGYQRTIRHDDKNRGNTVGVPGDYAGEFLSHGAAKSAFAQHGNSTLGLEIRDTPSIPWHPLNQWRGPHQHGGIANDSNDDTAAIQAAMNTGAATIYLPNGTWIVNGTVTVPASVRRIIGCEAYVNGNGTFVVATAGDPLIMERIQFGLSAEVRLEHSGTRTVVLSAISEMRYTPLGTAPGDVFIEDVNFNRPVTFRNQRAWARQLNQESDTQSSASYDARIVADNATVWIYGLKTERAGTVVKAINNSKVEVTGAYVLANTSVIKTDPIFDVVNSQASFAGTTVRVFSTPNFQTFLRETRGATTQTLANNGTILLAAAYPTPPPNTPPVAVADSASVASGASVLIPVLANDTDANGDPRRIVGVTPGRHGRVAVENGQLRYTPLPGHQGADTLLYRISDGRGGWSYALVTVTTSPGSGGVPTAGLIGHWPLNEGNGTVAADAVGAMNINFSGTGTTWASDSQGPYVDLANPSSNNNHLNRSGTDYSGLTAVSVSFWIKPRQIISGGLVSWLSRSGGTYYRGFETRLDNGRIRWELVNPPATNATSGLTNATQHPLDLDQWNHIACTWDATTGQAHIYVNGSLAASHTHSASHLGNGLATLRFGQTSINSQELNGGISEVRLYERALTTAEIALLSGQ